MKMSKQRLEAISDGVIAIIITIMVLNIPLPATVSFNSVVELLGTVLVYFISFIVVGSFWTQHNRIFSYIDTVNNNVIWINLLYLFFLSLIPIFTKWVMENPGYMIPVICYDIVYLVINLSYMLIFHFVIHNSEHELIQNMRNERSKMLQQQQPKYLKRRMGLMCIVIVGVVRLCVFRPGLATYFLLGIPVVSSIMNLVFDDYKRKTQESKA